jgi:hypothetical protein
MGEIIKVVKPVISHKHRKWIRNITKKIKIKKEKTKPIVKVTFNVKLSPSEKLRQHKIKKRIYDLDYYWKHKNEINIRQRRNYKWNKEGIKKI